MGSHIIPHIYLLPVPIIISVPRLDPSLVPCSTSGSFPVPSYKQKKGIERKHGQKLESVTELGCGTEIKLGTRKKLEIRAYPDVELTL